MVADLSLSTAYIHQRWEHVSWDSAVWSISHNHFTKYLYPTFSH